MLSEGHAKKKCPTRTPKLKTKVSIKFRKYILQIKNKLYTHGQKYMTILKNKKNILFTISQ